MTADSEARRIATEVMDDFRKMFPAANAKMTAEERRYLIGLMVAAVRDALEAEEDDGR